MSPSLPKQIALLLSKLSSSRGIRGIVYMPFRKYLKAIDQPLLGMGPSGLDANGGTFVASLVSLERTTEASACSSGRGVGWVICGEKPRKIMENMSVCEQNASSHGAMSQNLGS